MRHTTPIHYRARHSFTYYVLATIFVLVVLSLIIDVVRLIGEIL